MSELTLNQLITIEFDIAFDLPDNNRHLTLVIKDAVDDDAAAVTAQWAAREFTIADLLGSLWDKAEIQVIENEETLILTGTEFYDSELRLELEDISPTTIAFADLAPAV